MKKHKARKILANNIVYYRRQKNWSQEEFAEALGTTPVYVSNLENAKKNTKIDYIESIADTFDIEVSELFIKREKVLNNRRPKIRK
ncbi:MAG: helix-turn-helix transcriptional regulator [Bacilli bacterium]|nr:helix-turn-helix transcriptional regulator [Bacilli bacterium]